MEEKKYSGYGYHGGGRKRQDTEARRTTLAISGTKTEIETLKQLAKDASKSTSRFIIEKILQK